MTKTLLLFGISFCALSVVMGAFGAHSLKQKLSEYSMSVYEKAVLYQFFHAFVDGFVVDVGPMLGPKIHLKSIKHQLKNKFKNDQHFDLFCYYYLCWILVDLGVQHGANMGPRAVSRDLSKIGF